MATATRLNVQEANYQETLLAIKTRQARVAVEGFPELGTFRADSEGNIRIPRVPPHSTLKVHAMADGYYDTHVVVPTGSTQVLKR